MGCASSTSPLDAQIRLLELLSYAAATLRALRLPRQAAQLVSPECSWPIRVHVQIDSFLLTVSTITDTGHQEDHKATLFPRAGNPFGLQPMRFSDWGAFCAAVERSEWLSASSVEVRFGGAMSCMATGPIPFELEEEDGWSFECTHDSVEHTTGEFEPCGEVYGSVEELAFHQLRECRCFLLPKHVTHTDSIWELLELLR